MSSSRAEGFDVQLTSKQDGQAKGWISVAAPVGGHLTTGTFQTISQADPTRVAFTVSPGSTCGTAYGTMTILDLTRTADTGVIDSFAAYFDYTCGTQPTARGEIRYHSAVGYRLLTPDHVAKTWGWSDGLEFTEDSPVETFVLTGWGSGPTTIGPARVTGDADQFRIVSDTCSGAAVGYGQTCSIGVAAHLTDTNAWGSLTLPDDESTGGHTFTLSAQTPYPYTGQFISVVPARILDTRTGTGTAKAAIGPGGVVHMQVINRGGVPDKGIGAVVVNVTVTAPTASGYLTLFPSNSPRPTASSLNFVQGETRSNSVTVAVGPDGKVDIYNFRGTAQVIVDVTGWYNNGRSAVQGGQFQPTVPERLLDTRTDWRKPLPVGYYALIPVDYGSYTGHIHALAVNITAVGPSGPGFLTAWGGDRDGMPKTSTVNYSKGSITPNFAVIQTQPCADCTGSWYMKPAIGIYTSSTTHVIVDIVGFYDDGTQPDGLRFTPMSPKRIVDSRLGQGLPANLTAAHTGTVTTPTTVAYKTETQALAVNLTGTGPTAATYLKMWPNGIPGIGVPNVSNINLAQGATAANAALTLLGPGNTFNIYNNAGTTGVVVDAVGTFWLYAGTASASQGAAQALTAAEVRRLPALTAHTSTQQHL